MRWLRIATYCLPLLLIALATSYLRSLTASGEAAAESITFAITTTPIGVDPLTIQDPISEEIESLLFDRLLGRNANLDLEGHLAESWSYASEMSFFFDFPRYAKPAWEAFQNETKNQWESWGITHAELIEDEIRLQLNHRNSEVGYQILSTLPSADLTEVSVWKITTKHSAHALFQTFRETAVEGRQVRRTWSGEPGVVEVFSAGNHDRFEREMNLYYENANREQEGTIELVQQQPFLFQTSMTMNLRDVQWHDGKPVTVADVLHSIELGVASGNQPTLTCALRSIQGIDTLGPRSFRVRYREEIWPVLEVWEQLPILPAHAWHNYTPDRPELPPLVGTGPFRIRDWRPEEPIVLERNETYFRGRPDNRRFVYQRVLENRLRRLLFQTHTIDSYEAKPTTYSYLQSHADFSLVKSPMVHHTFVSLNLDHPAFRDARVRRALAHSVNVDALIFDLLGGSGKRVDRVVHPAAGFAQDKLEPMQYDLAVAQQLLKDAGWDGKLEFSLTLAAQDDFQQILARRLLEDWRRLGADVQLRFATYGQVSGIRSSNTQFDAALLTGKLGYELDQFARWHSTEIGTGLGNYTRLRDEQVDELLTQIRTTKDEAEARAIAGQLQSRIYDLQPNIHLFLAETARVFHRGHAFVRDKTNRGGSVKREIGENQVSLTHDLAWWVKLPPESVPE
ncbi:MAG: ABC transporter substrate-binding protein, partial [Verrucomicrobiota bacterium]